MSFSSSLSHLGYGVFENGLSFKGLQRLNSLSLGKSTINGTLRIEESNIVFLRFGSAKIHGQASLNDMESVHIKFGEARFDEKVSFNKILCETILNLGNAVFKSGLSLEESVVRYIHADSANLGDLTLVNVYFESFYTGTATASKLTIQGDTDSFREDCIDTICIENRKGDPSPNSLTTRLALAMKEMEPRYYKLGLPHTIAYFFKKKIM